MATSRPSPTIGPGTGVYNRETSGTAHYACGSRRSVESSVPDVGNDIPVDSFLTPVRPMGAQPGEGTVAPRDVSTALNYALELVRYGALLVTAEGHPQLANRTALAILDKKDGLLLSRTGLIAERAADTALLLRMLQEAISIPDLREAKDSPLLLRRKTTHSSLVVRVVPGPRLDCWSHDDKGGAALMMLYDQDAGLEVDGSILSRLYGLTRGEATLAASLMRGRSIEEAADEMFISPHTARTHLKRIFMKTDTHRQTELVARMLPVVL